MRQSEGGGNTLYQPKPWPKPNQEGGNESVKMGGNPIHQSKPKPTTTPNQIRVGKPNQKGNKNKIKPKEGGQPTIIEQNQGKSQKQNQLEIQIK